VSDEWGIGALGRWGKNENAPMRKLNWLSFLFYGILANGLTANGFLSFFYPLASNPLAK